MSPSNKGKKARIDLLLVERALVPTRARAQAMVMAGAVRAGGVTVDKPGAMVDSDAEITVSAGDNPFVSRGGLKLQGALDAFASAGLDVSGKVAVDIGASTGGFTDCLLSRGTAKVYAVDVGYGQLADKLRRDGRVVVRERTNARDLSASDFGEAIDLATVDASFIGLGKLMPAIARIVRPGGALVALVKPQFEAGVREASKGRGVIRDADVREQAIASGRSAVEAAGFRILAEVDSALAGPKGNVERFLYATRAMNEGHAAR